MSRCYLLLMRCWLMSFALIFAGCLSAGPPLATSTGTPELSLGRPDGALFAQVRAVGPDSRIGLSTPAGQSVAALDLPGQVDWLAWHPSGDLLIVTTSLKHYSFGTNYQLQLHRWDGKAQPLSRTLADTSLKPLTLFRWGSQLHSLPKPALSSQGDVLAFLRLHDPPAFDPYLKVILLHLDAPGELVLGSQSMPGAALNFSGDGEVLSWSAGVGQTVAVQPWLGGTDPGEAGAAAASMADPLLLELRRLQIQGLLSPEDYRQQWQKRRQP